MKLWILEPIDDRATFELNGHTVKRWTWDCAYGFVVRAMTEDDARKHAMREAGDEGDDAWLDDKLTSCQELSADGEPGIVLKDFLTG